MKIIIALDVTEKRLLKLGFKKTVNVFNGDEVFVVGRRMDDTGEFGDTIEYNPQQKTIRASYGTNAGWPIYAKIDSMYDLKRFMNDNPHGDEEAYHLKKYPKKVTIDVWLIDCSGTRTSTIMEVKKILNMDLQLARKLVMKAPVLIKACSTASEAEDIKHRLEAKGAEIHLR
jgi:ribosomal protein L7/L12